MHGVCTKTYGFFLVLLFKGLALVSLNNMIFNFLILVCSHSSSKLNFNEMKTTAPKVVLSFRDTGFDEPSGLRWQRRQLCSIILTKSKKKKKKKSEKKKNSGTLEM